MADTADDDSPQIVDCPLHKCIFEDDYRKLSQLIRTHDVGQKDKHGKALICASIYLDRTNERNH